MALLRFEDVTIRYPIYNSRAMSMRHQLVRLSTGGRIAAEAGQIVTVTALDGATFELREGDAVGLIGHNGAGKTTLLRTMAGIYTPSSGRLVREGSVTTVFELGAGMDLELSGYDNVVRVLMLIGHSRAEAEVYIPEIESFTELGDYMRLPVRTYSAGMTTRLMFAVATAARPSILLVDEVFGAGDQAFQERATTHMRGWIADAEIFVFASHDIRAIKSVCNRIFILNQGKITETTPDKI